MTMPTPNQTTPDSPERARGETPEQIAARVAEKFCVLTKQADSTQEYLTRLISEELTKERSVYEEIIRDDCEEFEANEKRIADLSAETTRLAEALKEAREQVFAQLEADMRSLKDTANETASADVPEGYTELEDTKVADACLQHGFDCMETAVLNWIHDQRAAPISGAKKE